jgi:peptide-methionine (S)-S-oxide reductase
MNFFDNTKSYWDLVLFCLVVILIASNIFKDIIISMKDTNETVVFGGGCFWCTEAVFKMLLGVISIEPGYSGGDKPNPTYDSVSGGITGHAEVVKVDYDAKQIKFRDLLTVFFGTHDPTTKNRQGNDVGTQYRSVIFYTNEAQKVESLEFISELNESSKEGVAITTEVEPLSVFYKAEDYHHDYYARNRENPYCEVIINPKLEKVQEHFANLLKSNLV